METTLKQVKELKLNVTNIHSFLVKKNKQDKKLQTKEKDKEKRKVSIKKAKEKEKKLEIKSSPLGKISESTKDSITSGGSILDKILNFGGLLLAGILVNSLPALAERLKIVAESVISFVTPVVDVFKILIESVGGGDPSPELEPAKIKLLSDIENKKDGILTELRNILGPFSGIVDLLEPLIDDLMKKFGNKLNISTSNTKLVKNEKGEEGIQAPGQEFVKTKWTKKQRERYDKGDDRAYTYNYESGGASGLLKGSRDVGTNLKYGLVNPTPKTNILENKGGYATDTGLDIIGKVGDPIVSPVDGVLEYAERGHTIQMGQDSDPTKPGIQDQLSFRIRLNKPFTFEGKKVNFVYGTHLSTLDPAVANKFGIPIKAGQKLGTMGYANNLSHLHIGFIEDRAQTRFLDFKEVRRLLSGHSSNREKKGAAGLLKGSRDERNKQMTTINQPDPRKRRGSMIIAIQPVNTIQTVPYMMPFPVASKGSSSASTPQLSALWT